jgi:hypothetical protein
MKGLPQSGSRGHRPPTEHGEKSCTTVEETELLSLPEKERQEGKNANWPSGHRQALFLFPVAVVVLFGLGRILARGAFRA